MFENWELWLFAVPATIIDFLGHFKQRVISQLTKGISSVLEKLLRYFNRTIILTSFVLLFPVCPVVSRSNLNETLLLSAGKSLILPLFFRAGLYF